MITLRQEEQAKLIIDEVCTLFRVEKEALLSRSRESDLVDARKFISYELYTKKHLTKPDIALLLNKSRCLIIYYLKDFESMIEFDKRFQEKIKEYENSKKQDVTN